MATLKDTAMAASAIIFANEGGYASINGDDNGALSVGKLQWHGERARTLLAKIIDASSLQEKMMLGDILNEVVSDGSWKKRTLTEDEAKVVSKFISTPIGKKIQDEISIEDIIKDMEKGMELGLTSCGALIYFADGANQYGRYSQMWKTAVEVSLLSGGDVHALHNAILEIATTRLERRKRTYKKVCELAISKESVSVHENVNDSGSAYLEHTVIRGDTLWGISKRYGAEMTDIVSLNSECYPNITKDYIVCGWKLKIPQPIKVNEIDALRHKLLTLGIIDKNTTDISDGCITAIGRLLLYLEKGDGKKDE